MAALKWVVLIMVSIQCFMANATAASRVLPPPPTEPGFKLTARLEVEADDGVADCWNALTKIKSCSNEIVAYFVDGTTDIGPGCCKAITMITHRCWPTMLTALGFTPDQANILRGYCDASAPAAAPPSVQPPAPADLMLLIV